MHFTAALQAWLGMAVPDQGWYYLDAEQQSQGPFPLSYLQGEQHCWAGLAVHSEPRIQLRHSGRCLVLLHQGVSATAPLCTAAASAAATLTWLLSSPPLQLLTRAAISRAAMRSSGGMGRASGSR